MLIAFREPAAAAAFRWPAPNPVAPPSVGELLFDRMSADGWRGAEAWRDKAAGLAPTIVGGSEKHGGADLGRPGASGPGPGSALTARASPATSPADGRFERSSEGKFAYVGADGPMITVGMGALIQGFPASWGFAGGKTSRWRQVGNAFPPPAARALGLSVRTALEAAG